MTPKKIYVGKKIKHFADEIVLKVKKIEEREKKLMKKQTSDHNHLLDDEMMIIRLRSD